MATKIGKIHLGVGGWNYAPWRGVFYPEGLAQAKELGEVDIQACSLSMDLLHLEGSDLDPIVDGVEGVTAFYLNTDEGDIVFI